MRKRSLSVVWENTFASSRTSFFNHADDCVEYRPQTKFPTGSTYEGNWNGIGMIDTNGSYVFPYNVRYEGNVDDGQFCDFGSYRYPLGLTVEGLWDQERSVRFQDGLIYKQDWNYLQGSDRRYAISKNYGLKPTPRERITGDEVPRKIPEGCYDTGDGFYDPNIKCVVSALDCKTVLRIPTATEEKWIIENCRKAWDEPVGYRPGLYEKWTFSPRTRISHRPGTRVTVMFRTV